MMRNAFMYLLSLFSVALIGCGQSFCDGVDCGHDQSPVSLHIHPTEGPHQGDLVELGNEEYHAEIVHDDVAGTVTAYVLDSSAKLVVPTSATEILVNLSHDGHAEQFVLAASPLSSDPPGTSSRFASTDAELAEDLDNDAVTAQLVVKIGGKQYRGAIEHGHHHGEGHHHGHDDALVWQRLNIQHARYTLSLGHHSKLLHAGEPVEPAVSIMLNGIPVSDAQVHNSLWSGDGKTLLAEEVRTTYEPPTVEEPAHYAQGDLSIPSNAKKVVIRFRVVFPGNAGEVSYDMPVFTEHGSAVSPEISERIQKVPQKISL